MGLKKWLQQLQPAPLYVVLFLTVVHFLAQMVICYVTHALTLLVDSCHMLCNIIALVGCMMTLKYEAKAVSLNAASAANKNDALAAESSSTSTIKDKEAKKTKPLVRNSDEKQLRNTFGWARIEVLMMLVVCVFFASLCFSVLVEALQTLLHISHMNGMRHPLIVLLMGSLGLLLNIICYVLIGGYTYHQGSFLHVTDSGEVVLNSVATVHSVQQGERRLSRLQHSSMPRLRLKEREGCGEIIRDVISCIIVILCALIVYFLDYEEISRYVDSSLAIISASTLLFLTYPYLKESCLILLQTIPDSMNIEVLHADLLKSFPNIVNIHDLHIWQLTTEKIVLTMHIIFLNPSDYVNQCNDVKQFLLEQGITEATIQPEFQLASTLNTCKNKCLMKCKGKGCISKHCCNIDNAILIDAPTSIVTSTESTEKNEEKSEEPIKNILLEPS